MSNEQMTPTMITSMLNNQKQIFDGGKPAQGKLIEVKNKGVRTEGNQIHGFSLWTYQQDVQCWSLNLAKMPDGSYQHAGFFRVATTNCG